MPMIWRVMAVRVTLVCVTHVGLWMAKNRQDLGYVVQLD